MKYRIIYWVNGHKTVNNIVCEIMDETETAFLVLVNGEIERVILKTKIITKTEV